MQGRTNESVNAYFHRVTDGSPEGHQAFDQPGVAECGIMRQYYYKIQEHLTNLQLLDFAFCLHCTLHDEGGH